MKPKVADITGEVMDMCHTDKDTLVVLKQIAWNLAYIADELAEANRLNSRTIGEIVSDMEAHGLRPAEE